MVHRPLPLPLLWAIVLCGAVGGLASAGAAAASGLPCQPCAGLHLDAPPGAPATTNDGAAGAASPALAGAGDTGAPPAAHAFDLLAYLRAEHLPPASPLFLGWDVELGAADATSTAAPVPAAKPVPQANGAAAATPAPQVATAAAAAKAVGAVGATPWINLVFTTPPPLVRNLARLQVELAVAGDLAAAAPAHTWFQVTWRPQPTAGPARPEPPFDAAEYGFLLKRATVALAGAETEAHVATQPLPADAAAVTAFYGADVAPYVDLVVLAAGGGEHGAAPAPTAASALAAALQRVHDLDAGKPVAIALLPYPTAPAGGALAQAARQAAGGFDLTLFRAPGADQGGVDAAVCNQLIVLAREFSGDLSYDPSSAPDGAAAAWAFVRGKDLALRIIAETPAAAGGTGGAPQGDAGQPAQGGGGASTAGGTGEAAPGGPTAGDLVLRFGDPALRRPTRFPFAAGPVPPPTSRVLPAPQAGLEVRIAQPGAVVVLGLERLSAAERQGVAEKVTVASERDMPVEEILKRLQVFEDAQGRRLETYTATDTTHLRFQPSAGAASVDVALTGPYFWSHDAGADWAWETLYVNGVRWRAKTLPQIPLIQPEKAAATPLTIQFTHDYRYRLRGVEKLDGRDAWVVDFAPAGAGGAGGHLYQGTVWIDRTLYARLKTRAVQLGLEGEVVSNEETLVYSPIDAQGHAAPWSADSFVLPLHLLAEQIFTILDAPTVVERETLLTDVRLNPTDFAGRRQAALDSDATMVRETDHGLRYLIRKHPGEPRQVKEGTTPSQLFGVAGLFYDDSLSYPLPLGGINYFSFDFKNTGEQANIFFAGVLLVASASDPRLGGTRFHLGGDAFAIAVPFTDDLYDKGREVVNQELRILPANFDLKLGHPIGNFLNVGVQYGLLEQSYSRNSNTAKDFVLPSNNVAQSAEFDANYARFGYTLAGNYSYSIRSSWRAWGAPGNPDYSPADRDFSRYGLALSKNWYLPWFQKIGAEVDYDAGDHLDRFSKYEFGYFGGTRIEGFRSNAVIASKAYLSHLSYGFDFGDVFRLDVLVDAALATDSESAMRNTLLGGTGLEGSIMGPWRSFITLNAGVPVAGPDHGFVLYLVFLKLFH
jgi:hypothetical protein